MGVNKERRDLILKGAGIIVGIVGVLAAARKDSANSVNLCVDPVRPSSISQDIGIHPSKYELEKQTDILLMQAEQHLLETLNCMLLSPDERYQRAARIIDRMWQDHETENNPVFLASGVKANDFASITIAHEEKGRQVKITLSIIKFSDDQFSRQKAADSLYQALSYYERIKIDPKSSL